MKEDDLHRQTDETPAAQASNLAMTLNQKPKALDSGFRWSDDHER